MSWEFYKNTLRNKVSKHESKLDLDALWQALEPDLDAMNKKKKRRRFFIIWFIGIGLFVSGILWFGAKDYFVKPGHTSTLSETIKLEEKDLKINKLPAEKDSNQEASSLPISTEINESKIAKETEKSKNNQTLNDKEIPNFNESQGSSKMESSIAYSKISNTALVNTQIPIEYKSKEKVTPSSIEQEEEISSPDSDFLREEKRSKSLLNKLPSRRSPIFSIPKEALKKVETSPSFIEAPIDPVIPTPLFVWDLKLSGGMSSIAKNLDLKDSIFNQNYLKNRNETETSLDARHFGLELSAHHKSGFGISTGLNHTTITERFDFRYATSNSNSIYAPKFLRIISSDTLPIYDLVANNQTAIHRLKIYNRYHLLDLPILFSYQYNSNKWNFGIQAGALLNLSLKIRGKILDEENILLAIHSKENKIFKARVGVGYLFGASVRRNINSKLAIGLTANYRIYPNDFTLSNYDLKQNYSLLGANLEVIYSF